MMNKKDILHTIRELRQKNPKAKTPVLRKYSPTAPLRWFDDVS